MSSDSLFWAAKYLRTEESVFNRTYVLHDDNEILEKASRLAADFFNDGDYDFEACTVLSFLGSNPDHAEKFREALGLICDDEETFVWVAVQPGDVHISSQEEILFDPKYPYKRMTLTELKHFF